MRVSDLIKIIQITTSQTQANALSDESWLELTKRAFPRKDLIDWFDQLAQPPLRASHYFAGLLIAFTYAMSNVGHVNQVVAAEGRPVLVTPLKGYLGEQGNCTICDLNLPTGLMSLSKIPLHQVALAIGSFDDINQVEAMHTLFNANYYHAARLYFFSGDTFDAWDKNAIPAPTASEIFRGRLYGDRRTDLRVIFHDCTDRLPVTQG